MRFWIILFLFGLFIGGMSPTVTAEKAEQARHILTLSDIHFDPFISCQNAIPCPLIQKLRSASVEQWRPLLTQYETSKPRYRIDTNIVLLTSTLRAAQKAVATCGSDFVLVLGDFLGHKYRKYYKKYSGDYTREGYQAFAHKTLAFLTAELAATFPDIDVYAVVGNNDTYDNNYTSTPSGLFFKETGSLWSGLIKNTDNRIAMQRQFVKAGYYALDLPNQDLRLIVLNSNLFSTRAKGKNIAKTANEEFDWLHRELVSVKAKQQKAFIVMHIPPSIDVYATQHTRLFTLLTLWQPEYVKRFNDELTQFSDSIAAIFSSHLHLDWFHYLTIKNQNEIPSVGVPSISPIFVSNPKFKLYRYSPQRQQLEDIATYYYPLKDRQEWRVESNKLCRSNLSHAAL